jgi:hypothetical protein
MVTVDEFWPKSVGAIRSITMEVVTAIFALASEFLTDRFACERCMYEFYRQRALADHVAGFGGSCDFDWPDHLYPHKANAYADRDDARGTR